LHIIRNARKTTKILAVLSNVAFFAYSMFLAFKFTGFVLGLRLKHSICKKATLDKKAKIFIAGAYIRGLTVLDKHTGRSFSARPGLISAQLSPAQPVVISWISGRGHPARADL